MIEQNTGLETAMSDTQVLWFLGWVWVGSLIPDIDNKKSTYGKHIYRLLRLKLKHRGITHGIWFLGLWVLLAWASGWLWVAGLAFGVGHHIAMDFLSKGSIALFYPLGSWKTKELTSGVKIVLPRGRSGVYTVGRSGETLVATLVVVLSLMAAWAANWMSTNAISFNLGV